MKTPEQGEQKGAKTTLYLADLDPGAMPTGKYFDNCREAKPHKMLEDSAMRTRLWEVCCGYLGRPANL